MPPRKSNASQIPTTADEATPTKEKDGVNIEVNDAIDITLPRTMVQRLAKGVLPPNTQIQKDAITAICKSATVFVNYLSQAHVPLYNSIDFSANTSTIPTTRKAISPDAVLDALAELEFEDFLPRVQAELKRFNELQTGKRNEYRRKLKEKEGTEIGAGGARSGGGKVADNGQGDGEERAAKRVRREATGANNATSSNSADKGVASEEVEEEDEEEDEAGKDNTLGDEGSDDDGTEEEEADEEEEDNSTGEGSGEERITYQDELDEADLDERTEVDDEEQSSEDSE
ncbi:hypothetical protein MMC07_000151 [Pseudocyphellaria aurata]|nr:hypothetical protein [Pseudocyphellaria aurata]